MYSDPKISDRDKDIDVRDASRIEHEAHLECLRPVDFAVDRIHWSPIAALKWSLARPWRNPHDVAPDAPASCEPLVMRALSLPGRHRLNVPEGEPARVLSGRALMTGLLLVGFDAVLNAQRGQAYQGTASEDAEERGETETAHASNGDAGGAAIALDTVSSTEQAHDHDYRPALVAARSDARYETVEHVREPIELAVSLVRQPQSALVPLVNLVDDERRVEKGHTPATDRNSDPPVRPLLLIGTDDDDVLIGGDGDDILVGGDGDDVLKGGAGNDRLLGEDGSDRLEGGADDDHLDGGDGDDDLAGGDGNDELDGGTGADSMAGGDGDDCYVVDDVGDTVIEVTSQGRDTVVTMLDVLELAEAVEVLRYVGEANFTGYGNAGDNEIYGADGDDELYGEADAPPEPTETAPDVREIDPATAALVEILGDTQEPIIFLDVQETVTASAGTAPASQPEVETIVIGSRSNDTIVGVHGSNDTIFGGKGNDRITGGAGDDILSGGEGRDTFIFRPGFGNDVITDFSTASGDRDLIVLDGRMFADEADLDAHMTQVGSDVVISVSVSDQIVLSNVDKLTISIHDQFIFA